MRYSQGRRQEGQRVFTVLRQEDGCHLSRVVNGVGQAHTLLRQKSQVKVHVLSNYRVSANERLQPRRHRGKGGAPIHVRLGNAGQLSNERWQRSVGIDQGLECVQRPVTLELDRAHLNDLVGLGNEPSGLQVQGDADLTRDRH